MTLMDVTLLRRLGPKRTSVRGQDRSGVRRPKGQTTRNNRRQDKGTNNYTEGYRVDAGHGNREREWTMVGWREATGVEMDQTGMGQDLQVGLGPEDGL